MGMGAGAQLSQIVVLVVLVALATRQSSANTSSSSVRSTLSSITSSSLSPGSSPGAANAAASAAAAAAAGAPFLALRGGRFADAGAQGLPAGFNTALIGVYPGQPQLSSSPANPPLPAAPPYTSGNYPTPWGDYPSVYPAINGYQQLDTPGQSGYSYSLPSRYGLSLGPSPIRNPLSLPSFGTNDRGAPPGTSYSTGATPGISSYLVRSINGYASSADLSGLGGGYGYPDVGSDAGGSRAQVHPLAGYLNDQQRRISFPQYLYGQL